MNITQQKILTESGTNELEIMEFTVAGEAFGINVAKVKEIMMCCPLKPMQKSHPVIEGVFKSRERVITVIDLAKYLGLPPADNCERDIFIVTSFSGAEFAFHVHSVVGIDRIFWTNIKKPDKIVYGGEEGIATGIADFDGRLIAILDFEKIVGEINPELTVDPTDFHPEPDRGICTKPIVVAEDSAVLCKLLRETLVRAGYTNITSVPDGAAALEHIRKTKDDPELAVRLLITDLEMPKMDGHNLLATLRSNPETKKLPVVIFSSIINDELKHKGEELGADAQITKPEINELIKVADGFLRTESE